MQRLKARFPWRPISAPWSRQSARRPRASPTVLSARRVFRPATHEEIEQYRDEDYPRWLERCEETLRAYHRTLQAETSVLGFAFLAENSGTRPAADALVTIEARGGFEITPPPFDDTGEETGRRRRSVGQPRIRRVVSTARCALRPLARLEPSRSLAASISRIAYPHPDILSRQSALPLLNRPATPRSQRVLLQAPPSSRATERRSHLNARSGGMTARRNPLSAKFTFPLTKMQRKDCWYAASRRPTCRSPCRVAFRFALR